MLTLDGEWGSPDGAHCQSFAYIHIYGGGGGGVTMNPIAASAFTLAGSAQLDDETLQVTQLGGSQSGFASYQLDGISDSDEINVAFQMYTGDGNGADGLCVNLGNNNMGGRAGEDGVAVGISLCFDEWSNGNNEHGVMMVYNGGNIWEDFGDCNNRADCLPVSIFEDEAWHTVVFTVTASGAATFNFDSGLYGGDGQADSYELPTPLYLGFSGRTGGATNNHWVREISIGVGSLSDGPPASNLYAFAGNADDSTGTNHGDVNGATLTADRFGTANEAYDFDGNDVITVVTPFAVGSEDFSIAVWLSPSVMDDGTWHGFVGYQAGSRSPSLWVNWNGGGNGDGMHWDTRTTQDGDGTRFAGVIAAWFETDTYVHTVWTAGSGGSNTFYNNGEIPGDGVTDAASNVDLHDTYTIGRVDNFFSGTIDEVAFYTMELSSSDVSAIFAAQSDGGGSVFIESVGDCRTGGGEHGHYQTLEGNDDIQTCIDYCAGDSQCHAFDRDEPFQGTCWLFHNGPGTHTGNGNSASRCHVNGGSVNIATYLFAGNADDASGSNHGDVNGATLTTDRMGASDSAYSFDGNDVITVATPFTDGSSDFSISIWLSPSVMDDGTWHGFCGYQAGSRSPSLWVNWNGGGNGDGMHWDTRTTQGGDGTRYAGVINSWFVINTYVHTVWTAESGGSNTFYNNGAVPGDGVTEAAANVDLHDTYTIGRVDNFFSGTIDEVSFYSMVLSADDITAAYADGAPPPPSGGGGGGASCVGDGESMDILFSVCSVHYSRDVGVCILKKMSIVCSLRHRHPGWRRRPGHHLPARPHPIRQRCQRLHCLRRRRQPNGAPGVVPGGRALWRQHWRRQPSLCRHLRLRGCRRLALRRPG